MANKMVLKRAANFALKGGGIAMLQAGDEVPVDVEDGQIEHKRKFGVFDEPAGQDTETLAAIGIAAAPAGVAPGANVAPVTPPAGLPAPAPLPEAPIPADPAK